MAVKKCDKCGIKVDSYSYGYYCDSCAEEVWDSGFESTSEHAHEVGFNQLLDRLDKKCDKGAEKSITDIYRTWGDLKWKCPKCKKVRMSKKQAEKMSLKKQIDKICKPCSCGEKKCALPTPPEKYFR